MTPDDLARRRPVWVAFSDLFYRALLAGSERATEARRAATTWS